MLFLSKLLPFFVYPLGAAIALGAVALFLSATRFRKLARALLGATLLALWLASTPLFANWLGRRLEVQHPTRPLDELPKSDVIILLGGILAQPLPPRTRPDIGEAGDRLFEALRLFRSGKAERIVVSGGNLPWQAAVTPEAELIADILVELGTPRSALVLETASRNTRENAVNTAAILQENGWRSGLLVTSAAHMPRALATFAQAGIDVAPAPADSRVRFLFYEGILGFLPDAEALARTTFFLKEWIGIRVYRSLGWA
jgi:uncharacterized SAM-binding protein YcdF (DUF218 family)